MDHGEWMRIHRLVVPAGIPLVDGPGPEEPSDYESGFVLPVHSTKPLQTLNRTDIDNGLEFHELPHVYTLNGVPASTSVTALAHEYESPFDPQAAIQMMKSSRSQAWPRLAYVCDARVWGDEDVPWSPTRGALLVSADGKTRAVCQPNSLANGTEVPTLLRSLAGTLEGGGGARGKVAKISHGGGSAGCPSGASAKVDEEDCLVYTFSRSMNDQEIQDSWSRKGTLACNKGTHAHYLAELFFNGLPTRRCPETEILAQFARDHMVPNGILAFNTEKEIVCKDADVAGSIDLIVFDPSKKIYHIVDHKRSDKLQTQLRGYGKMREPFQHLDDCKGAAYALQTSIYQFILERDYGMIFGDRVLLSLHPDAPFVTSVPYLKEEVRFIMDKRIQLVKARNRVRDACPDGRMTCALTKAPLVDAVVLPDGRRCMLKAAVVRKLDYERDEPRIGEFTLLVEKERERMDRAGGEDRVTPFDKTKCLSWKKSMPVNGLPNPF